MTVVVQGLTYRYRRDGPAVIKNINFRIAQGEIVAVTGLSGCGKSTLCNCLCGIIPHCQGGEMSGEVLINGKNTRQFKIASLALQVGMVFQNPDTQLFSPTVEDEIAFAPENMCLEPEFIRERVDNVLALLEINEFREANPCQLSGGEKQLVALAAVLALDPPVLILDEVMSQLDSGSQKKVAAVLEKLHKQGKTIIMVEHDLETVAFTDRLMVINDGEIVRFERTESLLADRDFLTASQLLFDDDQSMNKWRTVNALSGVEPSKLFLSTTK
ncbi:MAG TPA: ABC transporter ATP-binding protein [Desulfosporosinus sp.]|nr:ABC transporter ATP-binding protein [Desulfosporosinus sp.]